MTAARPAPPHPAADGHADAVGLVLAAGSGTRFGFPKALAEDDAGWWLPRAAATLRVGGVARVVTVLGAGADRVLGALESRPEDAVRLGRVVVARDWHAGMSASLRAGLRAAAGEPGVRRIVIVPVDLPGLPHRAVARLLARTAPAGDGALARASWAGVPGHPAVIGVGHLARLLPGLTGDRGAGPYLRGRAEDVECGDLGDGADRDRPVAGDRPVES